MDEKQPNRPRKDTPMAAGPGAAVSSSSGSNNPYPTDRESRGQQTFAGASGGGLIPGAASLPSGALPKVYDAIFELGAGIAHRYEIVSLLGEGGMGAVYKAKDLELDRMVALKVIRPNLAKNPEIIERFRQELRLSHQVTHKNVIRIYDLGESDGMKFITMEFVEGQDLRSLIEVHKKFSPAEAVEIMQQLCRALEAAHNVGVIHRDLKPQNIMRDHSGRIVLMDFGLARSIESEGMTQTGALVGTMEYMSPEQALGKELDQRSDIFALGLIFYELLTGIMPFKGDGALASLIKRTHERAVPVITHDAAIPARLDQIVCKCLERDPAVRYTTVADILHDLQDWESNNPAASLAFNPNVGLHDRLVRWATGLSVLLVVILVVVGGVIYGHRVLSRPATRTTAESAPTTSLAIMPYRNASGDPTLDWLGSSIADTLSTGIGQSAQLRIVSSERLNQLLQELHISAQASVDVATLRRLAEFTNADTMIFGQYVKSGTQIRIDSTVLDLRHDTRSTIKTDVAGEKDLLSAIDTLSHDIRTKLAATPETLKELQAHALRPSTNSIQAMRAYDNGLDLVRGGKNLAAVKEFESATTEDPNFALAFSKLGEAYASIGHDDQAENASRKAVAMSDSLPAPEKYLIDASYARVTKNTQKAIESYKNLAKVNPQDSDVQLALAELYEKTSNFDEARKYLSNVLAHDPKFVAALRARGRVEIEAGSPEHGLEFLTQALNLAIQLDNQEEKASILQAMGIAYDALGKQQDALVNFQQSLAIKKEIGDKRGIAASLEQIASIQDAMGNPDAALSSYKESLSVRQAIGDKEGIGNTLIDTGAFYHDHGKPDEALKLFSSALQIERDLGDESKQALCLNNIGSIHLDKGDYQDALTYLDQAFQLRQKIKVPEDIAESLHNLAETNTKLGEYDTALNQYLQAIETRRGVNDQRGIALDSESMAHIFAARGRYGAALGAMQEAVKIFQQLKERSSFTVEIDGGWGDLLGQVGRGDEGRTTLEDALNLAHQIKDEAAASSVLLWMGDGYLYKGDYNSARQQYDRALQIASKRSDRERALLSKVGKAKVDINDGHAQASIKSLRVLAQEADALGLKSLSVECSVELGSAMVATNDYKAAREELERALARAEKLGLLVLQAKAHYLLGSLLVRTGNNKEATPHYRDAVRILEGITKEDGAGRMLERVDIRGIYRESMKAFQGAN